MGQITAEIAPGTDHPTLDSIKQRNTTKLLDQNNNYDILLTESSARAISIAPTHSISHGWKSQEARIRTQCHESNCMSVYAYVWVIL